MHALTALAVWQVQRAVHVLRGAHHARRRAISAARDHPDGGRRAGRSGVPRGDAARPEHRCVGPRPHAEAVVRRSAPPRGRNASPATWHTHLPRHVAHTLPRHVAEAHSPPPPPRGSLYALSIVRFLAERLPKLPLALCTRLIDDFDILMVSCCCGLLLL